MPLQSAPSPADAGAGTATLVRDFEGIDWLQLLESWGLKLLAAAVIFLLGRWLAKWLVAGLERVLGRAHVDATLTGFLRNVSYAVLLVLVIMTALTALGVPTTSMLAVLGAAGLAVGLALKDSLSNIASGVMLIVLRPFRVGHHVVLAGQEGTVEDVRVFQTRIRASDQRVIVLPNSEITTAPIVNFTALPTRRIEIVVGIGYGDEIPKARDVLLGIARDEELVLEQPEPAVEVKNLGESSIELLFLAFARNADYGAARSRMLEAIHSRFGSSGIQLPYPQRDVHFYPHGAVPGADAGSAGAPALTSGTAQPGAASRAPAGND